MLSSFRSVFSAHKRTLFALTLVLALALTCTPAFADESSGMPESDSVVPSIGYRSHLSNVGWGSLVEEGVESGNRLGSNPVECVELTLEGIEGDVRLSGRYLICGETDFQEVSGGASCSFGTTGRGKRLNAIAIDSPSGESDSFDIYYRVYLEHYGWLEWATNGELAGSNDPSLKIYAVQMVVARSGSPSPVVEDSTAGTSYIQLADLITYSAHVAGIGWLPSVSEGSVAGTTGRSLSMEALRVSLGSQAAPGAVEARGHVAGLGWQDWSEGGCGTEGRAKALEAVCLRLTGEAADAYDIWYRVHSADFGWMGWAKNGEEAGSSGFARAAQAVEVRLLPKGSAAPGDTSGAYVNKSGEGLIFRVAYAGSVLKATSSANGEYRYVLPAAATPDQVSITYESGHLDSLMFGSSEQIIGLEGSVSAAECGVSLTDAHGETIAVRHGGEHVASITLCKSSNVATLSIVSSDPINQGRDYVESSPDHSLSTTGSMTLVDATGTVVYDGGLDQIKGRGNTTWSAEKKPYQIKLSKKTDLLQTGIKANKAKTWVLLANAYDMTGLRNLAAYNLAALMGVQSAVESRPVDLFYDGEYRGTYQLCEKVQVNTGRVDIHNLEDDIDDLNEGVSALPQAQAVNKYGNVFQYTKDIVNPDDITGGYLVEYDPGRYASEASWFTVEMGGKKVAFVCKSPEYWSYEQAIYLSEYFQEAFDAISSGGVNPETGKRSTDYFDADAAASLYWLYEMTLNSDGLSYSSTFIYKDQDGSAPSKLIFGPAWDFDNSLGNPIKFTGALLSVDWWFTRNSASLGSFLYGDYYLRQAIDSYRGIATNTARNYLTDGTYDATAEEISSSMVLNKQLWGSNSESAATLKYWFLSRLDWIRSQY